MLSALSILLFTARFSNPLHGAADIASTMLGGYDCQS